MTKIKPGRSYPLGATHDGAGTNFSLFLSRRSGSKLVTGGALH